MQYPNLDLPFSEYRFLFQAKEGIGFPEYTGSMWRGAFGHALRDLVCCGQDEHHSGCRYRFLFDPVKDIASDTLTERMKTLPVPYVFRVQRQATNTVNKGGWFSMDLLLVAKANEHIEWVVEAIKLAAEKGLGKGKGKARLIEVIQKNPFANQSVIYADELYFQADSLNPIPQVSSCNAARIHLETPLNLGDRGIEFSTQRFLMGVVRRISLLQRVYGDVPLDVDFSWLKQQSTQIESKATVWSDGWVRHSSRQKGFQPVRGWLGDIFLQGESLHHFWPYLFIGQWLHTGKMTNSGLGRYQLQKVVVKNGGE